MYIIRRDPSISRIRNKHLLLSLPSAPLSACENRVEMSSGGKLSLWNHVPYCHSDGSFEDVQCNAHTGNCWCVGKNGLELTETHSREMPNCVTPSKLLLFLARVGACDIVVDQLIHRLSTTLYQSFRTGIDNHTKPFSTTNQLKKALYLIGA